ncbi:MAG: DUF4388 domain-containing protein [Acidobacteriota bacterium]|nr:DUF4388 domain-containing protein [Acidobacteriota bacterium]
MAIEGNLSSVDIQDIVQLLNLNQSTGLLHIQSSNLQGLLYYREGDIVNAEVEGMTGSPAAYVLLSQSEGSFNFEIAEHQASREIHRSIHDLVLETARRKDTISKIRASIKHDNIVFLPLVDVRIPHLRKDFNEFELKLLSQLDGQTEVKNIIDKNKETAFEIFYVLYDLEQRGFLKRVDIYKILDVEPLKKLFGKNTDVHISQEILDEWLEESMTYAECEFVEIRTRHNTYGQVSLIVKPNVPPSVILVPPSIMKQFEVTRGEKVLVKPILDPG